MSVNKLAHVVWENKYHIVIVPEYRHKFFSVEVKTAVRDERYLPCLWGDLSTTNEIRSFLMPQ